MATNSSTTNSLEITRILKQEYLLYLSAQDRHDMVSAASFLSPSCRQLARQTPTWNLESRDEIMAILTSTRNMSSPQEQERGKVEMRELTPEEKGSLPDVEKEQARKEGWEGLRVSLEDKDEKGRRVEVVYWWRVEEGRWVQCFHDLLWVGPRESGAENNVGGAVFGRK